MLFSHRPGPRGRARRAGVFALALCAVACADPVVDWTTSRSIAVDAAAGAMTIDAAGDVVPDSMVRLAAAVNLPRGPLCAGSLRLARAGGTLHAVWWAPRPDSGARLLAARSDDRGATWSGAVPVDTLDRGTTGCRRAPPSVAADSASGYVHVSYGLQAPEGPGLFFAHSMDGGRSFHSPVPIVYGERLGWTSVAADGDLVGVGFEDPNSATPRIGLALSRTMGHIFEHRLLPVSDDNGAATRPTAAVRGRRIAIAWERHADDHAPSPLVARVLRAGVVP